MIDVCLLGNGGMMPLPERPLSATLIRTGGEMILFDCGEGTQVNWRISGWPFRPTGTILLSHVHADHVAGLPGILFQLAHSGRTEPVTIFGPEYTLEIVQSLASVVGRLPYEVHVARLDGGEEIELADGMTLTSVAVRHRMPCLAYRLDLPRAPRFDPERARALGVPVDAWSRLQRGETIDGVAPEDVLGEPRRGLRVTLITDTARFDELETFARDSDLLICEAMYASDDDAPRAKERGHMTALQAAELAVSAGARRLWLTHFSPSVERSEDVEESARRVFPNAVAGYSGLTASLAFIDEE